MESHPDKYSKDLVCIFRYEVHPDLPESDIEVSDLSVAYRIVSVRELFIWLLDIRTVITNLHLDNNFYFNELEEKDIDYR